MKSRTDDGGVDCKKHVDKGGQRPDAESKRFIYCGTPTLGDWLHGGSPLTAHRVALKKNDKGSSKADENKSGGEEIEDSTEPYIRVEYPHEEKCDGELRQGKGVDGCRLRDRDDEKRVAYILMASHEFGHV